MNLDALQCSEDTVSVAVIASAQTETQITAIPQESQAAAARTSVAADPDAGSVTDPTSATHTLTVTEPAGLELAQPANANFSADDCRLAQQKAQFIAAVWSLAQAQKLALKTACGLCAARAQEDFPELLKAGKGGRSAVGETTAWPNYRSWCAKLGLLAATRKPNTGNWRALLPEFRGSRQYARPGATDFWCVLARFYEHPNCLSLRSAYDYALITFDRHLPQPDRNTHANTHTPSHPKVLTGPAAVALSGADGAAPSTPTYAQVHHYYTHHADRKAVLIARHGVEWFNNNVAGYIMREAPRIDECWFSDHHIFDAACRIWDADAGKWVACRPWLTAWMDWGSLYFHGVLIRALSPNRDSIERALRQGVLKNGNRPPQHLYIDNGKDYTACLNDEDKNRISSISSLLGCQVHFAIPYNARAKVIERIFGIVCVQFSKLWESYRGSSPEKRPVEADDAWQHPERLPTLDQFAAAFEQWLAAVYNRHPSQGAILKGACPDDARRAVQPLREPLDAQQLYKAFLRELPGPRKIGRGGMVRGLNRWYRGEVLWQALGRINEVRVKIDPDDISTAWVYTADGRELGPVREVQRLPALIAGTANETPQNIETLRQEMALQAHQRKEAKAQSAQNRGLAVFPRQPKDNAAQVFRLPEEGSRGEGRGAGGSLPSMRSIKSIAAPASAAEQALADELDDALRADTAERLGNEGAQDLDAGDAELLALIEQEQAEKS